MTALISLLLTLIKPFEWCFPAIYNLPEQCISMLASPIPLIVGVKLSA